MQAIAVYRLLHGTRPFTSEILSCCGQIGKVPRLETDVEPGKPLLAYHLGSLSAVEIRARTRTKLTGELSTLDNTNAFSNIALREKILDKALAKQAWGKTDL